MRGVTEQRALALAFVYKFQLTRLMRGVTHYRRKNLVQGRHFNSHASCEA